VKKLIKQILLPYLPFLKRLLAFFSKQIRLIDALKVDLCDDREIGEIVFNIKQDTNEELIFMKIFNHVVSGKIVLKSSPINVLKYLDAMVFASSDFILTENTAIWPKSKYPQFTKIVPLDKQLIDFKNNTLIIKKPQKIIVVKNGFSLCGVHSKIWAHFMVQYLPKIDYLERLVEIIGDDLTLITPDYNDFQINEIINTLSNSIVGLKVLRLKDDDAVRCENLYYVENTSRISDHSTYVSPSDILIPQFVLFFLKEKFVSNPIYFPSVCQSNTRKPFRKLFISRGLSAQAPVSGNGARNIANLLEIEEYFKKEGFEFISPHEYSLVEKRKIFQEAKIILGPGSSGFTNIIFCQPGTKVLVFINFQRVYDLYAPILSDYFNLDFYGITGVDDDPSNIHSSYSISLDNVIHAYKELI
jgi:hypothetical protein